MCSESVSLLGFLTGAYFGWMEFIILLKYDNGRGRSWMAMQFQPDVVHGLLLLLKDLRVFALLQALEDLLIISTAQFNKAYTLCLCRISYPIKHTSSSSADKEDMVAALTLKSSSCEE